MTDAHSPSLKAHPGLAKLFDSIEHQVDPWAMQRKLMEISNQSRPVSPELNNDALMYGALVMEEGGETFKAMADAIERIAGTPEMALECNIDIKAKLLKMARMYDATAKFTHAMSKDIRAVLDTTEQFRAPLLEEEAIELADGTTDITVVNSGLAIAAGFNGGQCYLSVGGSNLSKANPETGQIDKEPNGKWTKGEGYFKPNLRGAIYGTNS